MRTRWTPEAIEYVRRHYRRDTISDMMEALKQMGTGIQVPHSLHAKAFSLGLKRSHDARKKEIFRATRQKFARAYFRLKYGLDPGVNYRHLGDPLPIRLRSMRYVMRRQNRYLCFQYDRNVYYDEYTERIPRREQIITSAGYQVLHISQRKKL